MTLPLIAPAVAAGLMLAFTLSLDDLVIASFTTGPGATTLPIRIYSEVRLGVKPEINAVCTIMIAVVAVVVVAASLVAQAVGGRVASARRASARDGLSCSLAARSGGPEQIDQEPDRHDHERAEQQVRQRPGDALRGQLHRAAPGDRPDCLHQLLGGDAEMRQDRADDQRRDRDLDQCAQEAMEHPGLVTAGAVARFATER